MAKSFESLMNLIYYDWEYVRLHIASTVYATLLLAVYPGQLQVMMPSVLFLLLLHSFHSSKHLGRTLHRRKSDRSSFFYLLSVHVLAMSRQCFPWLGPFPCLQDRMVQEHHQLIMDLWTEVIYKHKCWRCLRIWVEDDLTQQFWGWLIMCCAEGSWVHCDFKSHVCLDHWVCRDTLQALQRSCISC